MSVDLDFDPDELRRRYREERDKRLRSDGNEQYLEVVGDFARYLEDPYVDPIVRDPLHDEVDVLIVVGGFGGLLAGARLREAGVEDLRIVEKGGDFGGTWYWNRYPGAACDVESYIYLPLLEEIGFMPAQKYTPAPEILAHSRAIGEFFDSTTTRASRPRSPRCAGTTSRHGGSCRPTAATGCGPVRGDGERPAAPSETAGHRGHREFHGAFLPHQPLGLRLHRRRLEREPHGSGRQASRPSSARAPRRCSASHISGRRPATCTCSSALRPHRRAQQPADRSGVGSVARTGVAAPPDGELQHPRLGRLRTRGPRRRRLDRHHRQVVDHGAQGGVPRSVARRSRGHDRTGRLREDGADPQPRGRPRERSGHRCCAEAVLPPVLQAAVLPRRVPRRVQPARTSTSSTPMAEASRRSPSGASSSTASNTRSTASSTPPGSRWAPTTRAGPATRCTVATASRSPRSGPTAHRRSTACTAGGSRTASS
jgi:hypothetical protein